MVVTDVMITELEGFHHRITRHITWMKVRKGDVWEWGWALVDSEMETTGLCKIS